MLSQKAFKRGSRLYRIVYLHAVHSPVRKTPLRNGFAQKYLDRIMPRILPQHAQQFIKPASRPFDRLKEMAFHMDQHTSHFARGVVLR